MAFVTKYKLKRALGDIEGDFNDPIRIYIAGKYYYLSDKETNQLTVYFKFLENPDKLAKSTILINASNFDRYPGIR